MIRSGVTILITTATITLDLIESLDVDMSNKPSWTSSYAGHTFSEWEPWVLNLSTTEALFPPPPKKKSTAPLGFGSVFLLSCLICSKCGDSGDTFSSDFYMGFVDHLVKKFFWMEYASWLPRRMLQALNDPYLDQKAGFKIRVGWRLYNEEIKHRRIRIRLSLFKVHTRLANTFVRLFS